MAFIPADTWVNEEPRCRAEQHRVHIFGLGVLKTICDVRRSQLTKTYSDHAAGMDTM
jgi:hypothetical protein